MFQALAMGGGLAFQLAGSIGQYKTAEQTSAVNQDIASQEGAADAQRHQQMILDSRRQQLQAVRQSQLSRSMALTSSTAQGAQFGTGLAGGLNQATSQGNSNLLGIQQNTEIGNNLYGINQNIDADKQRLSSLGSQSSLFGGISSFGGSMTSMGASIGGNPFMSGSSGSSNYMNSMFGGGSPSGYGA